MGGVNFPHQPPPESWDGGRIERIDIETGEVDVLYEECDGHQLRGPNDLVFDAHGGFWFTDHGAPAGALEPTEPASTTPSPTARASARRSPPLRAAASTGPIAIFTSMSEAATLEYDRLLASGKVREIYDAGDRLLMVASDRISTYDVVHPTPIPGKGQVLTGLSVFWFERTGHIVPNHVISFTDVPDEVRGRALLVEKLEMFPVECVVRGYITGPAGRTTSAPARSAGSSCPPGLRESEQLPEPIFTPATKADVGDHDENVDFDRAAEILGDRPLLEELRRLSIELYTFAADHARERGIILADTKFEFGRDADGRDRRSATRC